MCIREEPGKSMAQSEKKTQFFYYVTYARTFLQSHFYYMMNGFISFIDT